ncbi:putative peptidase [Serratia symbiotica str. 'Cinara cedri']|nr:putative peptidase [Serratia symbiotica str. 'Cinara cedri']
MEFISVYSLFLAKITTVVIAISALVLLAASLGQRKNQQKGKLQITDLGETYREMQRIMKLSYMSPAEQKIWRKKFKKQAKSDGKIKKQGSKVNTIKINKPCLYVLDFQGSMDAREVNSLREEISAVLAVASTQDAVLLRLESPGGVIHGYGLAASQLERLRKKGIRLTVAVDKVAASGGYMMACVADSIVAAPFSIIGSIGVIAQIPNFYRLLKKNYIDVELYTAGQFKRTLTLFGKNTEQRREKFQTDLNNTHELFKQFVYQHRPSLDIDSVSNGEHWFGIQAKEKGLIDEVGTSDDLIIAELDNYKVISVRYMRRKRLIERFSCNITESIDNLLLRWWQRGNNQI